MKNTRWLTSLYRNNNSNSGSKSKSTRKRRASTSKLEIVKLEARQLLASVAFDAGSSLLTFTADAGEADTVLVSSSTPQQLEIQVAIGDEFALEGDAVGNPDFNIVSSAAGDVLEINLGGSPVSNFVVNLGDGDDSFEATSLASVSAITVDGGIGSDSIDVSAISVDATLIGGAGGDTLIGGAGDDVLAGGGGSDTIDGGAGIDTNSFAGIGLGVTAVIQDGGSGTAVYGGVNETFAGIENLGGSDNDDNLTGNNDANQIDGGLGNDIIDGSGGDDVLLGGSGADQIAGGTGNDRLIGGFGNDELNGGGGDDSLVGNGQIEVTVTNLATDDGFLLTPVFLATQNGVYDIFDVGSAASENLERLAEDGITSERIAAALGSGGVGEAQATEGGPLAPGATRSLTFYADPDNPLTRYLSYASMVIPSNDAFIGNDSPLDLDLFDDSGNLITRVGDEVYIVSGDEVWDAGTEVNDTG